MSQTETKPWLCVDLDGTLIHSDTLWESALCVAKTDLWAALHMPFWLMRGKANLKHQIASRTGSMAQLLPYRAELIEWLKEERASGRPIGLVTGANEKIALDVAKHLGLFDTVQASNLQRNLTGSRKAKLLTDTYGDKAFHYVGNSRQDLPIWKVASGSIVVDGSRGLLKKARSSSEILRVFPRQKNTWLQLLKCMRPHQWSKNLLVLVPLILSFRAGETSALIAALTAVASFSFCASAVYLLNDLLDLDADRLHPKKRLRPLAQGTLPVPLAALAIPVLLAASALFAFSLSPRFALVLGTYFVLTTAYSLRLKQIALVDVILLALLYTWRVFAGAIAIEVALTPWLLAFSSFFFLSLALAKRVSELVLILGRDEGTPQAKLSGRDYLPQDLHQLTSFGAASAYVAVLVMALFVNSPEVALNYSQPLLLWLICPLLLYWVSRLWLLVDRGLLHHDPVVFALRDRVSWQVGALVAVVWLVARSGPWA